MTKRDKRGGRRKGAGRKALMQDARKFSVLLPAELLARVDRVAARDGLTRADVIRMACAYFCSSLEKSECDTHL